jgi:hypothetical protein
MNSRSLVIRLVSLLLAVMAASVNGFATKSPAKAKVWKGKELPSLDVSGASVPAPKGTSSREFYLPPYTLLRAGPVSFLQRVTDSKTYEKTVYKYMQDFKEDSLMTAQGNADAYLASPGRIFLLNFVIFLESLG